MGIRYQCKHCGTNMGEVGFEHYGTIQKGLQNLTEQERDESVTHSKGNLDIQVICDDCQETVEENPHYFEYGHFIQ